MIIVTYNKADELNLVSHAILIFFAVDGPHMLT